VLTLGVEEARRTALFYLRRDVADEDLFKRESE